MSLQEESVLPPPLAAALESVRTGAYTMPTEQLHGVLSDELGADWRELFSEFSDEPLAAASIGQVSSSHASACVEIFWISMVFTKFLIKSYHFTLGTYLSLPITIHTLNLLNLFSFHLFQVHRAVTVDGQEVGGEDLV